MSLGADDLELSRLSPEYRAAFEARRARIAELAGANTRLEHLVRELRHAVHGKRSEKLTDDERQLAFEDLEVAVAEVEEQAPEGPATPPASRRKRRSVNRNIANLPEGLPRIEEVIEPESTLCPCGCGEMHRIGEDRTERLDIVPARLRVIVTVRPKYACRACTDGVTQAPAAAHLIEGALPTEGAIAHVLVSKYADHCPLYRQSQILARSGIDLDRSTLAGWVGKAAFHLGPVVDRLAEHLKRSTKLFTDGEARARHRSERRAERGAGARSRPGSHEDRLPLGARPRRPEPGRRRSARRRLLLRPRPRRRACRDLPRGLRRHPADRRLSGLQPADQADPKGRRSGHRGPLLGSRQAQASRGLRPRRRRAGSTPSA